VKRLLIIFLVITGFLVTGTSAAGYVQVGADWGLEGESLLFQSAGVQWWSEKRWGLRGAYSLVEEDFSGVLLYKTKEGIWTTLYTGLGVRDLFDLLGTPFKYRVEFVAGLEVELGHFLSGFSTAGEIRLIPAALLSAAEELQTRTEFSPFLGVSLNYRFGERERVPVDERVPKDEVDLLARLITAEAEGEPYDGQVAVGAVVINRVKSTEFPNSIKEVIYQRGQFCSVPKLPGTIPTQSAARAAREALNGKDPSGGALFFYNPDLASVEGARFFAGLRVTVRIGNHVFMR